MVLTNFKGLRNQEVILIKIRTFTETWNGKTTLFDAFTWMLLARIPQRKDFEIKTLDQYNVVIPKNRTQFQQ
jgi:hypothetical protein